MEYTLPFQRGRTGAQHGNAGPNQGQSPSGQTANPRPAPGAQGGIICALERSQPSSSVAGSAYVISFFGQLHSVLTAFLPKYISCFWHLQHPESLLQFCFTSPASCTDQSQEFCVGNPTMLHGAWPQPLSGAWLKNSMAHSFLYLVCFQLLHHMNDAANFCCQQNM